MAKKRSNGEGNVRKLRNGRWTCSIMDGYKADGRRNIVTFSGDTKTEVLDLVRAHKNILVFHSLPFPNERPPWKRRFSDGLRTNNVSLIR